MAIINTEYALQAVKGIKESFDNSAKEALMQYKDSNIMDFYETDEVFEIFTSTESMAGVTLLDNDDTPPLLNLQDGYTVTITEHRFGGAIKLDEQTYRRNGVDSTLKVDEYLARQAAGLVRAATKYFLTTAFAPLNDAFAGATYVAPDTKPLIANDHAFKSGVTFDNYAAGVTFDEEGTAYDAACEYAGAFVDGASIESPLNWTHIIVKKGSAAARAARKLFASTISPVAVGDINLYEGELTIVETPFITAANAKAWFLRDGSIDNSLKVGIGQFPTLRAPIVLENEAVRTNVTGFMKVGIVNVPFDWYAGKGA